MCRLVFLKGHHTDVSMLDISNVLCIWKSANVPKDQRGSDCLGMNLGSTNAKCAFISAF